MMPTRAMFWITALLALVSIIAALTGRTATMCVAATAFFVVVALWIATDE
jgi:hypothetical protein